MKKLLSLAICALTLLSMATTSFAATTQNNTIATMEDVAIDSRSLFDLPSDMKLYEMTNVTAEEAIESIRASKALTTKGTRNIQPSATTYIFSSPEEQRKFIDMLSLEDDYPYSARMTAHTINPNRAKIYSPSGGGYFDCGNLLFAATIAKFPDEREYVLEKVTSRGTKRESSGANYSISVNFTAAGKMKPKLSNVDTKTMNVTGTIFYDNPIR